MNDTTTATVPFETRANPAESGNMLLSYGTLEDELALARGFEFMGCARDSSGGEVHVFRMLRLPSGSNGKVENEAP